MNSRLTLLIIVIVGVTIGAGVYVLGRNAGKTVQPKGPTETEKPTIPVNFSQEGAFFAREDGWILLWDEPGRLALTVKVKFTDQSVCYLGGEKKDCALINMGPESYDRVSLEGERSGDEVTVTRLEEIKKVAVPSKVENQYSGWQEYVNPKYNYLIKYPPDWFFHKTGYNPPPPATIELSNVDEKSGFTGKALLLEVSSLPAPGESLETNGEIQSLSGQGFSKKTITISGEPGVKLEKEDQEGGVNIYIYVYHQGNVYRMVWNLWNSEIRRLNEGLLQKIIDSFVFTD